MNSANSSFVAASRNKGTRLGACSSCVGRIIDCDNCGQKIEILNSKPLNYHEGTLHRCGRGGGSFLKPTSSRLLFHTNSIELTPFQKHCRPSANHWKNGKMEK